MTEKNVPKDEPEKDITDQPDNSNTRPIQKLSRTQLSSRMSSSHSVGVQFPDSDVIKDNLHGAQIVAENRLLLKGNSPQSLDWSDYGFKMHCPQDTLPPHDTCEVAVLALIGGNFQIPEGTELVSAIFSVSFAKEVSQPVQVEIEHCVELTSQNDADEMIFVATDSGSLGVLFKAVDEAKFIPDNKYGIVDKLHFSGRKMGVAQKERPAPYSIKRTYLGCLFYQTVNVNPWIVEFFVTKNTKAHNQSLKKILENAKDLSIIELQFSDDYLQLVLSQPVPTGWKLLPHTEPLHLARSQVDRYLHSSPHQVSCCKITVCGPKEITEATERQLNYPIELQGVKCTTKMYIILDAIDSSHDRFRSSATDDSTDHVQSLVAIVKDVFRQNVDKLSQVLHLSVSDFARKMHQDDLITAATARKHSYFDIIEEALGGLEFLRHKHEIEKRCSKILGALTHVGGPCADASQAIKQQLKDETSKKLNIELNI